MRSASQVRILSPAPNQMGKFSESRQRFDEVPVVWVTVATGDKSSRLDLNDDGQVDFGDVSHIITEADKIRLDRDLDSIRERRLGDTRFFRWAIEDYVLLFGVVFFFSVMGAIASMFYSKKQRDAMGVLAKADAQRQEFISVCVNGIENVKGLALEPGLKDEWRNIEANYIGSISLYY